MVFKPQFIKSKCGNTTFFSKYPIPKMAKIAVYTFNASSDVIPTFNTDFKNYKIEDLVNSNGTITRTISSYELPTKINFRDKSILLSVEYINTSNVTDMSYMFSNCASLTSLDLSNFDTSNVTDMHDMFYNCSSLTSLDLSNFNTSKVTNMRYMFFGCSALTSLNLSNFNTSNVTDMNYMFPGVPTTVDWHYDGSNYAKWTLTEKQTDYSGKFPWNKDIFAKYTFISSINTLPTLRTGNVYQGTEPFTNYTKSDRDNGDGTTTRFLFVDRGTTNLPTNISFNSCNGLISVEYLNTSNMHQDFEMYMFENCTSLEYIDNTIMPWTCTCACGLFLNCTSLKIVNLSGPVSFNGLSGLHSMFNGCSSLEVLNLSTWDTTGVHYIGANNMFVGVPATVDWCYDGTNYTNWNLTEEQTGYSGTFPWNEYYIEYTVDNSESIALNSTKGDGHYPNLPELIINGNISYDYRAVRITKNDNSLTSDLTTTLDQIKSIRIFYPSNVTSIKFVESTIYNNDDGWHVGGGGENDYIGSSIDSVIYVDTKNFTSFDDMFYSCDLESVDASGWDTSNVISMRSMFSLCSSLTSLDLSGWDTSNVTNMSGMFANCDDLISIIGLEDLDTGNVTNMRSMFHYCSSLTSLDLSAWDTSNVTDMSYMFNYCSSLTSLNLSTWNTKKVNTSSNMFTNVSTGIDWHYDGTNYTNCSLKESYTGYAGTFPWNTPQEREVTVTLPGYKQNVSIGMISKDATIRYPDQNEIRVITQGPITTSTSYIVGMDYITIYRNIDSESYIRVDGPLPAGGPHTYTIYIIE